MKLPVTTVLIALLIIFISTGSVIKASIQDTINVTVSIGICGNGIIEGTEQCDGSNLAGDSCQSIGYDSGSLICDSACSFDPTVCSFIVAPTPTSGSGTQSESVSATGEVPSSGNAPSPILIPVPRIPLDLAGYDTNRNGIIDGPELATAVGRWVNYWRDKDDGDCDLNRNGQCDLVDFSILLYYSKP